MITRNPNSQGQCDVCVLSSKSPQASFHAPHIQPHRCGCHTISSVLPELSLAPAIQQWRLAQAFRDLLKDKLPRSTWFSVSLRPQRTTKVESQAAHPTGPGCGQLADPQGHGPVGKRVCKGPGGLRSVTQPVAMSQREDTINLVATVLPV